MYGERKAFKDEDDLVSPFRGIEKASVVQEVRVFNDNKLRPLRCIKVLVRLMWLVNQGESLSAAEATDIFFSVTKLFQSDDAALRRMTYLAIKELAHTADEVIIVTNCLTKDITSTVDSRRANATRVLCKITDASMVAQIERYLKQELVDRNANVASAALISAQALLRAGKGEQTVRRWVSEVTQALSHHHPMVQYHALALLYQMKKRDRLAVSKLVQDMARQGTRSPLAAVLLVRYVARVIDEETAVAATAGAASAAPPAASERGANVRQYLGFLESMLRHRADMVIIEAARAICSVRGVTAQELQPAINVLQLFLVSPKPTLRYAAIRTLSRVAVVYPGVVTPINTDIENLIGDANRSIATAAITTLLRTGTEASVDRLLKQISKFIGDIGDDYKVTVVEAIRSLTLKYPQKHYSLMTFLGNALREEGGLAFKRAIVDTYMVIMEQIPESKEMCFAHLCEFIEDCEHVPLSTQVLHLLGEEGPKMPRPSKYIRHVYNRVILENSVVRAAAVSALAKFAECGPELRHSVSVLLRQCLLDSDDEVRDRAAFYLDAALGESIEPSEPTSPASRGEPADAAVAEDARAVRDDILHAELPVPVENLEDSLVAYLNSGASSRGAFDMQGVSRVPRHAATAATTAAAATTATTDAMPGAARERMAGGADAGAEAGIAAAGGRDAAGSAESAAISAACRALASVPELAQAASKPFKSSPPVELTEAETEFTVSCFKHVFDDGKVVLQFRVTNTLRDQMLSQCAVRVDTESELEGALRAVLELPAAAVRYDAPEWCYCVLARSESADPALPIAVGGMASKLVYKVHDVDEDTGEALDDGYDDEYVLEELSLETSDYIQAVPTRGAFRAAWDELGDANEMRESFALGAHKDVQSAVRAVVEFLGMAPCEGTGRVAPNARAHALLCAGVFVGEREVMCRCDFSAAAPPEEGVNLNLVIRASDGVVSEVIAASVA